MHLEYRPGVLPQGLLIVRQVSSVRRANLTQAGGRGLDELRQTEARTNLNKFATGNDDLLAGGQGSGRQQQRGCSIVNHQRVLRAGTGGQDSLDRAASPIPRALTAV